MFAAGAAPGEDFPSDEDPTRRAAIESLEGCVTADAWFPPVGTVEDRSVTFGVLSKAIRDAKKSIDLAPDMLSHPGIKAALETRARKAVADGDDAFRIRLVLDASPEAFGNPAFGTCLVDAAAEDDLPIEVRYWPGSEEIFQLLHHKFMIVDAASTARAVFNGSANYSPKAMKQSWENVTRFKGATFKGVIDAFVGRFERIFDEAMTPEQLEDEEGMAPPACPGG
jgi:phosphatidylserine/phosphatidylglycerophosphate/cardiolipin synthase-like enzyme